MYCWIGKFIMVCITHIVFNGKTVSIQTTNVFDDDYIHVV